VCGNCGGSGADWNAGSRHANLRCLLEWSIGLRSTLERVFAYPNPSSQVPQASQSITNHNCRALQRAGVERACHVARRARRDARRLHVPSRECVESLAIVSRLVRAFGVESGDGPGCSRCVRAVARPMVCSVPRAATVMAREVARRAIAHRSAPRPTGRRWARRRARGVM
jgi:hypothetical protein